MKRVITLFAVLLMGWSVNAWSFACKTANGTAIPIGGGSAHVFVNLAPPVNVGQKPGVGLLTQIFFPKDYPETISDHVTLQRGTPYCSAVSYFFGAVKN
ncbi:fimbrial protein, partial [Escherichia coli]|uniref:fimbrial protein n=1 Tax=Escherichia coli TaxID=562 RepID=UPI001562A87F